MMYAVSFWIGSNKTKTFLPHAFHFVAQAGIPATLAKDVAGTAMHRLLIPLPVHLHLHLVRQWSLKKTWLHTAIVLYYFSLFHLCLCIHFNFYEHSINILQHMFVVKVTDDIIDHHSFNKYISHGEKCSLSKSH